MTFRIGKRLTALPLLLCTLAAAPLALRAQDDGINGPPKVLFIQREFLKPGKGGMLHEKTEGAYIAAMKAHKGPVRYFALNSISGPYRALFFSGYSSFAALEAENKAVDKDAALSAALDHANVADGDLLADADASLWTRNDEMSHNTGDLVGKRYMELELFRIKPGHEKEWEDAVKLVKDGYKKGLPEATWVMYQQAYGVPGNEYLVITTLKSMAEVDANFASGHKFVEAMGEKGMKQLEELSAASIEAQQTNLFQINPRMSNPPEPWIAAEPDFWKPKMAAPKKPAPKPAP
jgi:hypothetical protein